MHSELKSVFFVCFCMASQAYGSPTSESAYLSLIIPLPAEALRVIDTTIKKIDAIYHDQLNSNWLTTDRDASITSQPHIMLLRIGRILEDKIELYEQVITQQLTHCEAFPLTLGRTEQVPNFVLTGGNYNQLALSYDEPIALHKIARKIRFKLTAKNLPYSGILFSSPIRLGTISDLSYLANINDQIPIPTTTITIDRVCLVRDNRVIKSYTLRKP